MRIPNEWNAYAWISIGAVLGANLRYVLSRIVAKFGNVAFPLGTLIINISGSLLLGFFLVWVTERVLVDPRWRWFVAIGFCGSYTTFSGYAFETMAYLQQGNWALFAGNIVANNVLCLGAVLAGAVVARAM